MTSATETPKEAARRLAASAIRQGFKPEALHEYRTAGGKPIYWRIRAKHDNGEKWIRPMMLNGHGFALREPEFPAGKKPLYHLDRIAADPASPVWIVEGEKPASALTALGAVATTSGGATSASDADWSLLAGRECVIWPDNDDPGKAYAGDVGNVLAALGCKLACVDVARLNLPPKGDAVEWLESRQNATLGDLQALPLLAYQPLAPNAIQADLASVELQRGDAIEMRPTRWIWDGYLAAGKLHVMAGAPGTGKTTLAIGLAANVTSGGRWPDGRRCEPGDVLIWSGEDDPEDTLGPRLRAAGADMKRVYFARRTRSVDGESRAFDPATDFPLLSAEASRLPNLRLLLLDPIVNVVGGADSHKNSEVKRALQPLADFADRHQCAVLGISHFSKGTAGRDPVERVTGSLAFGAAARVVIAVAKLPEDDGGGRVMVRAKSNIGPDGGGFRFDLNRVEIPGAGLIGQRVLWGDPVEGAAREILGTAETEADQGDRNATADAEDFLREELKTGPLPAAEIRKLARAAGHADRTLARAKASLGIRSEKVGLRDGWTWTLPPNNAKKAEECRHSNAASLGNIGILRGGEASAIEEF